MTEAPFLYDNIYIYVYICSVYLQYIQSCAQKATQSRHFRFSYIYTHVSESFTVNRQCFQDCPADCGVEELSKSPPKVGVPAKLS